MLHHAEHAHHPLVAAVVVRLHCQFLRHHVLVALVDDERLVVYREVLVDGLSRLDILERCLAVEAEPFARVRHAQSVGAHQSAERAAAVVADVLQRVRLHVDRRIGVAPLVAVFEVACQPHHPFLRRPPAQSDALLRLVHPVNLLFQEAVVERSVVVVVESPERESQLVRQLGVVRHLRADVVIASVAHPDACVLIVQGVVCVNVDDAPDGVAAVERALRSPQHLHRCHVAQVAVERQRLVVRHAVHVESHAASVRLAAYTSYIYGAACARSVVRHIEVWYDGRQFPYARNLLVCQLSVRHRRARQWHQVLSGRLKVAYHHLVQFVATGH